MARFYVIGRGEFPFDMLRHDRCWPAETIDAAKISPTAGARRTVCLETSGNLITVRRWESFNWRVSADGVQPIPSSWQLTVTGAIRAGNFEQLAKHSPA